MKIKHLLLLVVLILGFQFPTAAQSKSDDAESFLRRVRRERKIPGLQAAVVRGGKIALLKSPGTADVQNSVPVINKMSGTRTN